jgi:hypothetical protein
MLFNTNSTVVLRFVRHKKDHSDGWIVTLRADKGIDGRHIKVHGPKHASRNYPLSVGGFSTLHSESKFRILPNKFGSLETFSLFPVRGAASVAVTKCHKLKSIDIHRFQALIFAKRKVDIIAKS